MWRWSLGQQRSRLRHRGLSRPLSVWPHDTALKPDGHCVNADGRMWQIDARRVGECNSGDLNQAANQLMCIADNRMDEGNSPRVNDNVVGCTLDIYGQLNRRVLQQVCDLVHNQNVSQIASLLKLSDLCAPSQIHPSWVCCTACCKSIAATHKHTQS